MRIGERSKEVGREPGRVVAVVLVKVGVLIFVTLAVVKQARGNCFVLRRKTVCRPCVVRGRRCCQLFADLFLRFKVSRLLGGVILL